MNGIAVLSSMQEINTLWVVLGEFEKLQKATVSFVMSVRMGQLVFSWTYFQEL
jgi:hypothetical protein